MIEFVSAPATLPEGQRVYAIGDIHGCLERLQALHAAIAEDIAARPAGECTLIHLGDYVDRGPESAEVVDLLTKGPDVPGAAIVNLMGNHEEMMINAISSGKVEDAVHWSRNGGAESLLSWRIDRGVPQLMWPTMIPFPHQAFLRGLTISHRVGPYFFVHAGVRPDVPLEAQKTEDLLWIREPFLSSKKDHGAVIVHGHTPIREPALRSNRIGIDTGAVMGGVLTCAVLEADKVGFFQV
jgi:serine/threonine protein phosphatase 1